MNVDPLILNARGSGRTFGLVVLLFLFPFSALVGFYHHSKSTGSVKSTAENRIAEISRAQLELKQGLLVRRSSDVPFSGWIVESYPDGGRESRSRVEGGILNGLSVGWHTNGVMAVREWVVRGKTHGIRTKWDLDGNRRSESEIKEGILDGVHREWYPTGVLASEVMFVNGKAAGPARRWAPDSTLEGEWLMSNGLAVAVTRPPCSETKTKRHLKTEKGSTTGNRGFSGKESF